MSPLLTLLSTVPPNIYIASPITADAWNTLPDGTCDSVAGKITDLKQPINKHFYQKKKL